MKSFLFFIAMVLLVYGGSNYYIYRRIMQAAALSGVGLWVLKFTIIAVVLAYPLGRALGGGNFLGSAFTWIGAFWLGAMVYGLLFAVFYDLIRFSDLLFGWLPRWALSDVVLIGRIVLSTSAVAIIVLMISGHVRAIYPTVPEIEIQTDKLPAERDTYSIVYISDVHLGTLVGKRRIQRVVNMINDLAPDLCLIGGDLVDEKPNQLRWIIEPLQRLDVTDGVYAVTGNHEFYTGVEDNVRLLEEANITVLRDTVIQVGDAINLAGLDDITGSSQYGKSPRPVSDIMKYANPELPTVLMHHTPTRKAEIAATGVDLMLSGHTHGGQIWPAKYLTKLVFKVGQGLTKIGNTQLYLSNGLGTWGPPVRICAPPEIVYITLMSETSEDDFEETEE